jgi:hypothetical protein
MANEFRFGKIPRHLKQQAAKAYAGSGVGQLGRAVVKAQRHFSRAPSAIPGARELTAMYRRGGIKGFVKAVSGLGHGGSLAAIEQYAKHGGKQAVTDFLRELGPIGSILGAIVGHSTGGKSATLPQDLQSAMDLIGAFADQPSVINALQRILEGRGASVTWNRGAASNPAKQGPAARPNAAGSMMGEIAAAINAANQDEEPGTTIEPRRLGQPGKGSEPVTVNTGNGSRKLPPDHPLVTGQMVETPQSSNVFAFGYDIQTHSLFVRFKEGRHEGGNGGGGSGGKGGAGGARPHRPGALYLYHNVPTELFLTLYEAPSKGIWVWDNLRIRGTLSGHRFDYALVGVQGGYVPRKATLSPAGEIFSPRTIFTDQGRQLSSSLPEMLVRPLQPLGSSRPPNNGSGGMGRKR